jgi:hypothetical protein
MNQKKIVVNLPTPLEVIVHMIEARRKEVSSEEQKKILNETGQSICKMMLDNFEKDAFICFSMTTFKAVFSSQNQELNDNAMKHIEEVANFTFDEMFNARTLFEEHMNNIIKSN